MNQNGRVARLEGHAGRSLQEERALMYRAMDLLEEAERTHGQASVDLHEQGMALLESVPFEVFMAVSDAEIARACRS